MVECLFPLKFSQLLLYLETVLFIAMQLEKYYIFLVSWLLLYSSVTWNDEFSFKSTLYGVNTVTQGFFLPSCLPFLFLSFFLPSLFLFPRVKYSLWLWNILEFCLLLFWSILTVSFLFSPPPPGYTENPGLVHLCTWTCMLNCVANYFILREFMLWF